MLLLVGEPVGKKRQRSIISAGELERLEAIKRLAIVAMFSDDLLMEKLVLKGGNAIDLVYRIAPRASMDLDFSMPGEFDKTSLPEIKDRLANAIGRTFEESGYRVFDVEFVERPERVSPEVSSFWGGYVLEFKIIEAVRFGQLEHDQGALRRNATVVAGNQKRTFRVDISKFEYCDAK